MKIDAIEVFTVNMPLVYPFRTAFGNDAEIESVIVKMRSGNQVGWGESTPWRNPGYSSEYAEAAHITIRKFLAPLLIGKSVESGDELQSRLLPIKGNYFAKGALDSAWWDLYSRMREEPLWKALGGSDPTISVGADFGVMDTIDELIDKIAGAIEEGFERTKLKFRPGWELDMVEAVRARFPNHTMHVDCNSAYRSRDFSMLEKLDDFDLAMVEQPLANDDLYHHSKLAARMQTPICLDESITSVDRAHKAAKMNSCRWINIKPGRLGGLTIARKVLAECQANGIPCWVGGMLESSLGGHQCLAIATLDNVKYPSDVFPSARFYREDLCDPPLELSGPSRMTAPDTPGSGTTPNESRLLEQTLHHDLIAAT